MSDSELHIRRARRTDFTDVMRLLATSGLPVPLPERATLHRFRNIVNDLGGDFYLAFRGEQLSGLVYGTYRRRLTTGPLARIEQLVVGDEASAAALLEFILQRARKRGCSELHATRSVIRGVAEETLVRAGLTAAADGLLACGSELLAAETAPASEPLSPTPQRQP